jgi:hypothetical protein
MTRQQAINIAIAALESEIARVQIEADLYDVWSNPQPGELLIQDFRTPQRAAASKRRSDYRLAIKVLRQHDVQERFV